MPISDDEITGIGLVTYQWSLMEHMLALWTDIALGHPLTRGPKRIAFKDRADIFRSQVKEKAVEPWRTQLIGLIDQATGMQAERDKVVHWLWSEDDLKRPGIMDWRDGKSGKWNVDYEKLKKIALKIDSIHDGFCQIVFATGKRTKAEGYLLSIAWQRVCGNNNPAE
jgi:hypothetical protein